MHQSVEIADTGGRATGIAAATSMLARHLNQSGGHSIETAMRQYLTWGSLRVVRSDSGAMATQQLSPWSLCSAGQALRQAIAELRSTPDTLSSGAPAISVFATPVWRLLILNQIRESLSLLDGELFVSANPTVTRRLNARLYAQPRPNEETSSRVLSVWHAEVPVADDEATSQFVSTVLHLALLRSTTDSKESK